MDFKYFLNTMIIYFLFFTLLISLIFLEILETITLTVTSAGDILSSFLFVGFEMLDFKRSWVLFLEIRFGGGGISTRSSCLFRFCQAQVQVQVGWRSGEGQEGKILTWAIPYFWFPPTHPPPTTRNFFLALKSPRHVTLTWEGLVWLKYGQRWSQFQGGLQDGHKEGPQGGHHGVLQLVFLAFKGCRQVRWT